MKKIFYFTLILITSIFLVSCGGDEKPLPLAEPNLRTALAQLKENYELEVDLLVYDELETTTFIKVDGNKSYYKEGEHVEFYYERLGNRELKVYEKQGDGFVLTTDSSAKDRKYDFFGKLKSDWFEYKDGKFIAKEDNLIDILSLFELDEKITISSGEITVSEENVLTDIKIVFSYDRDPFTMHFKVKNIDEVTIALPEVK